MKLKAEINFCKLEQAARRQPKKQNCNDYLNSTSEQASSGECQLPTESFH